MFYNIYGNDELSGEFVTATVGVYRSVTAAGETRWTNPSYTIEEETISCNSLYGTNFGTGQAIQTSQVGNLWLPPGFEYTESYTKQYFYIGSNFRFEYYYYSSSGHRIISFPAYEILQNGNWVRQTLGGSGNDHREERVASIEGFRLTIIPKGKASIGGYHNSAGDMLCIDIAYRAEGSSTVDYFYCACGIAPYEKILLDEYLGAYKPKKNVRRGGRGSGTIRTGTIPSLPTTAINTVLMASCQGYGAGLTYYKLTGSALSNLTKSLYPTMKISDKAQSARRDALIGIIAIPYDVPTTTNQTSIIYLADKNVYCNATEADFASSLLLDLNFGYFDLEGQLQDSFADILYTSYTLYLPGVGSVNIDPASCAQGVISVTAALDIRNGNIIYQVRTRSGVDKTESLYGHYSGNVGTQIPISGVGGGASVFGMIQTIGQIAAGAGMIATGVAAAKPVTAIAGAQQLAGGLQSATDQMLMFPQIDHAAALDANIGGLCTPGVRLMVQQNVMLLPNDYIHLVGVPSAGAVAVVSGEEQPSSVVGDYAGKNYPAFVIISDIDISGFPITEGEKAEILRLLKEGVLL